MQPPVLVKSIPAQITNERAAFGPFNFNDYIQAPDGSECHFSAVLDNDESLPKGMICTADGLLTGIPAKGTAGNYLIKIVAANDAGEVEAEVLFTIKPSMAETTETQYIDQLKTQVWEALEQQLPLPELTGIYDRPVTIYDVYYLLERWGTITIWDAFNLEPPGEKHALQLEGASKHYHVYDRGSCLIATPKDLFSHERTLEDGLMTARAMAREVYNRKWTVELVGFDKFTRAAWVEIQHLGDKHGHKLEVINYQPTPNDVNLYYIQSMESKM